MGSKGTRPPEPGTSKGQIKQTFGNGPGGNNGKPAYWEWSGTEWKEITKAAYDAGGSVKAAQAVAVKPVQPESITSGSKRYPGDLDYASADYMIFEFFNYVPPFSSKRSAEISLSAYNFGASKASGELESSSLPQIVLYMPEGVSASYKANWDGKKFGNIAAGILSSAGSLTTGDIGAAFQKLGKTTDDTSKRAGAQLGAGAISAIIGGITGDSVSANDIFSAVGGQILNPNAELIFGGHDLRTFSFTYKLVPYNATEAETIFGRNGIIATFKKAMLPSFSGDVNTTAGGSFSTVDSAQGKSIGFIKNPNIVQPYFMNGTAPHQFLPFLKPCTITDFDVNYTADGVYAAHDKGYPAAAEISISLIETKLVYAEDINNGF